MIKSRRIRWPGHVARMGERRGVHRVLVGIAEGKKPLGRLRHRWKGDNMMDLQKWNLGIWTGSVWLRIETGGGHL